MLKQAAPGLAHDTIQTILRDEIGHSRIGWAYLAHEAQHNGVAVLSDALPKLLEWAVTDELFEVPDEADPDRAAMHLGAVPRDTRLALFQASLRDLVFPGLERFGVDISAGKAWLATQGASPHPG